STNDEMRRISTKPPRNTDLQSAFLNRDAKIAGFPLGSERQPRGVLEDSLKEGLTNVSLGSPLARRAGWVSNDFSLDAVAWRHGGRAAALQHASRSRVDPH